MHRPDDAFPSIPQAAFLLLGAFLLQYVITAALYDFRGPLGLTPAQLDALSTLLANGVLLVVVLHIRSSTTRDLLHPASSSPGVTFLLLVPPVLMLVPLILLLDEALIESLQALFPLSKWEEQAFAQMASGDLPTIVSACILAPVLEEMVFRGVLLRAFLERYPRWYAISASALFFGVAHYNIYQFMLAFWLGLFLGWLFERSRSLIPCITLHGALNGWITAAELGKGDGAVAKLGEAGAMEWSASLVAGAIGAFVLYRLLVAPSTTPARGG